jgi:hypothetical protein
MKRYWFYGRMPKDTVLEKSLSDEQKESVDFEKNRININNYHQFWLGYYVEDGWDFMRNGLEIIHIDEPKGNIARDKFKLIIKKIYGN